MNETSSWRKASFKAMGGPCEIRAFSFDDRPLQAAADEVRRLEAKYSRYREDSVTTRINRHAGCGASILDPETALLLSYADDAWRVSDGLFDITSGVLRKVWDFRSNRLPVAAEVKALLRHVGWQRVTIDAERLILPQGMEIDFGGIVKEYAADRAVAIARQSGAHAVLVELAGDIAVSGPLPDGSAWQIRIRHPGDPKKDAGRIELAEGAVATSGDYERCVVIDGKRYSHLLDPRTGWPVQGLASVTVRHQICTVAGTLATIGMLKGADGAEWLRKQGVDAVCIPA